MTPEEIAFKAGAKMKKTCLQQVCRGHMSAALLDWNILKKTFGVYQSFKKNNFSNEQKEAFGKGFEETQ